MRFSIYLFLCLLFSSSIVVAEFEFTCPNGCGIPEYDSHVGEATRKLLECVEKLDFCKTKTYPDGGYYDYKYIYKDTLAGEKKYRLEALSQWFVTESGDDDYDEDDDDYLEYYLLRYDWFSFKNENEKEKIKFKFRSSKEFKKALAILERDSIRLKNADYCFYANRIKSLEEDILKLTDKSRIGYISSSSAYFGQDHKQLLKNFQYEIQEYNNKQIKLDDDLKVKFGVIAEYRKSIEIDLIKAHEWCIKNHNWKGAYYEKGRIHFDRGENVEAFYCIKSLIECLGEEIPQNAFLVLGETENELGHYDSAIYTLSKAINLDLTNKKAFLARAEAYFETGNFDASLVDYLAAGLKPQYLLVDDHENLLFSIGILKGIIEGGVEGGVNFIPSLISSAGEISHALWAFAADPIEVSQDFIDAAKACIQFIQIHTTKETLCKLAPEIGELIQNWSTYGEEKKGELTGRLIGKHGIELFAGAGITKSMKLFRDLKRANNILTFEAISISKRNKNIIKLEALKRAEARKQILKNANLEIQLDKQGKHIPGHKNYNPELFKSIFLHENPQKLIDEFAGKGFKTRNFHPGEPGYKEIVDFGEFIGYIIDNKTKQKIPTSWGSIHYAKDGVHIVPARKL